MKHEVRIYPQSGRDEFFGACLTTRGNCLFETKGDFDTVSCETRKHYRDVGQ